MWGSSIHPLVGSSLEVSCSVSALPEETAYASVWEDTAVQAPEQWLLTPGDLGSSSLLAIARSSVCFRGAGLIQRLFFLPLQLAVSVKAAEETHVVSAVCHGISKHATGFPAKMSSRVS